MAEKLFLIACLVLALQVTLSHQAPGNRKIRQTANLDMLLAQFFDEFPANPSTPAPAVPVPPTIDPDCLAACATNEYNPVCGTDAKTYNNARKLECSLSCGLTGVKLQHLGMCRRPDYDLPNVFTLKM